MAKGSGKFVLGAVLGAIAGAAAGLLFAPKKGSETRKIIKDKAGEYVEKGKEIATKEGKAVKEAAEDLSKKIAKK